MVQPMQNCNKLIPAVTANKILCRYAFAQLNRKIADIFIAFIMAKGIVDGTQIIQVKYTDCGLFHFFQRFCPIQQLFTLVFIGQAGGFVQVDFALQNAVCRRIAQCLDHFKCNQNDQAQNIHHDNAFQLVQF